MNFLVNLSLSVRFLLLFGAASLVGFTWLSARDLPVDFLPEFKPVVIEVQTEALGLSAVEVENLVTLSLEEILNATPQVQSMTSKSVPGLSSISIVFEPGTNLDQARQLVHENIGLVHILPNVASAPVIMQPTSSSNRVMMVGLTSEEVSLIDMSVLARWNITPALLGVDGVANIAIWGEKDRQLQALVDPAVLQSKGVSLDQVVSTAGDTFWVSPLSFLMASSAGTGGWIDTDNQRLGIMHNLPISDEKDFAKIPVEGSNSLVLSDVASVEEGHQPLIGTAFVGNKEGLILVVEKFPGGDVEEITRQIEAKLENLKVGLDGVEVNTTIFKPATFVNSVLGTYGEMFLLGSVLLFLSFLFFYRWQIAVVGVATIAFTFSMVIGLLFFLGVSFNLMILLGVLAAMGAIVDNVIRNLENITSKNDSQNSTSRFEIITQACCRDGEKVFMTMLILVLILMPVFFIGGSYGLFIKPLAFAYIAAVLCSFVAVLTFMPALMTVVLSDKFFKARPNRLQDEAADFYSRIFTGFLAKTYGMYVLLGVMFVGLVSAFVFSEKSVTPVFQDENVSISWEHKPGTSLGEMTRVVSEFNQKLENLDGVEEFGSHIGRAVMGDRQVGLSSAQTWLRLDGEKYTETIASIEDWLKDYPEITTDVSSYATSVVKSGIGRDEKRSFVRVYGPAFDQLKKEAEKLEAALAKIEGLENVALEPWIIEPQIEIEVDLEKAKQYGLKPGDVRRAAATLVNGLTVGFFFEDQKVYEVVVRGQLKVRDSLESLQNMLVYAPSGSFVKLSEVADVRMGEIQDIIHRESFSRYIDIHFDSAPGSVMKEVEQVIGDTQFVVEYRALLFDNEGDGRKAMIQMLFILLSIFGVIYLILQALFGSWKQATILFLLLPLALSGGGVMALIAEKDVTSLGSLVGAVIVLGVTLIHSIGLVARYRKLLEVSPESLMEATAKELPVILMSMMALLVALLPFFLLGNTAGHEVTYLAALVVIGGLVSSLALNLLLLPALYLKYGDRKNV